MVQSLQGNFISGENGQKEAQKEKKEINTITQKSVGM
jgi:hypothetical protein